MGLPPDARTHTQVHIQIPPVASLPRCQGWASLKSGVRNSLLSVLLEQQGLKHLSHNVLLLRLKSEATAAVLKLRYLETAVDNPSTISNTELNPLPQILNFFINANVFSLY